MAAIGCACFVATAYTRRRLEASISALEQLLGEIIRMATYAVLFVFVPVVIWTRYFFPTHEDVAALYWAHDLFSVAVGGFFLISHFPERTWPGRFDFIFMSHNFLHVFGGLSAYLGYRALLMDIEAQGLQLSSGAEEYMVSIGSTALGWAAAVMPATVVLMNAEYISAPVRARLRCLLRSVASS
eukprot:m.754357 g.754357  ORF g.754357 m.754357 type:complete len:184 (-) comp59000_c0_seq21:96-647(-)